MKKFTDLKPWMAYFDMLKAFEDKGFLEVYPDRHEAYVTEPALFTLITGKDALLQEPTKADKERLALNAYYTMLNIRAYAGWKSQEGAVYITQDFSVHAVSDSRPHRHLYTLLLTRRRRWWRFWKKTGYVEFFDYREK